MTDGVDYPFFILSRFYYLSAAKDPYNAFPIGLHKNPVACLLTSTECARWGGPGIGPGPGYFGYCTGVKFFFFLSY